MQVTNAVNRTIYKEENRNFQERAIPCSDDLGIAIQQLIKRLRESDPVKPTTIK